MLSSIAISAQLISPSAFQDFYDKIELGNSLLQEQFEEYDRTILQVRGDQPVYRIWPLRIVQ